jgi:hypothetical protein
VVRMCRVGHGIHELLVVNQPGRRTVVAGNQLEPVQPTVAKVVFVEGRARTQCKQLIQGANPSQACRPVLHTAALEATPLRDLRKFAVGRPQRRERVA